MLPFIPISCKEMGVPGSLFSVLKDSRGMFVLARRCFTQAQKLLILRRAGYKCQLCGAPLTEENFEADHKFPFSKGGATEVWNALALCASCNRHKSDDLIDDDVRG